MLNSSRPFLKQKAIIVLYKVFLKFPEALRPSFPRLKERLEDPDQGTPFGLFLFLLVKILN